MDSTLVTPEEVAHVFGVSVPWLVSAVPIVIGIVNTIKVLAVKLVGGSTVAIPALGLLASGAYAAFTLDGVEPIMAGTCATFAMGWATWFAAKAGATKLGLRDK
jgi:hypothetical protein